jgi:hypothetical protein
MSIAVTGLYEGFSGPRDIPANGKRKSVPDPLAVQMQGLASDWSMIRNGMPSGCAAMDTGFSLSLTSAERVCAEIVVQTKSHSAIPIDPELIARARRIESASRFG